MTSLVRRRDCPSGDHRSSFSYLAPVCGFCTHRAAEWSRLGRLPLRKTLVFIGPIRTVCAEFTQLWCFVIRCAGSARHQSLCESASDTMHASSRGRHDGTGERGEVIFRVAAMAFRRSRFFRVALRAQPQNDMEPADSLGKTDK